MAKKAETKPAVDISEFDEETQNAIRLHVQNWALANEKANEAEDDKSEAKASLEGVMQRDDWLKSSYRSTGLLIDLGHGVKYTLREVAGSQPSASLADVKRILVQKGVDPEILAAAEKQAKEGKSPGKPSMRLYEVKD